MIGALRQAHKPLAGIRAGKWRGEFTLGHDPNKKILGIIGMGGIGRVSTILLTIKTCPFPERTEADVARTRKSPFERKPSE